MVGSIVFNFCCFQFINLFFIFVDNSIVTMEKRMTNFNYKLSYSLRLQLLLKKLTRLHSLII